MTRPLSCLALAASLLAATALPALGSVARAAAKPHSRPAAPRCAKRNRATGTIRYSDWQFPDTLNPEQTQLAVSQETLDGMFDNLFIYNGQGRLVPQMATAIPTVRNGLMRNGGKTIIVHLKPGLRWSNGRPFTSADIRFDWRMGMDRVSGPYCEGTCDVISRIDTPNQLTAIFHLTRPYGPFLAYGIPPLVAPNAWPGRWKTGDVHTAATNIWQNPSFNWENASYPTDGAYQVASFVRDDRIVLHPMRYYSGMVCGGYVQNMVFAYYSSAPAMLAAAVTRQTDVSQNYTLADLPELRQHTGSYHLHVDPSFNVEHLELNHDARYNGRANPLHNANVRLALALALDKTGLIRNALGGSAASARGIEAWTFLVSTPHLVQPFALTSLKGQYDPLTRRFEANTGTGRALADARKLLARAGYARGFTVSLYTTAGNPIRAAQASVIAADWARIGVHVSSTYVTASRLFADWRHRGILAHGSFQVAMFAYLGAPDPDQFKFDQESRYIDRARSVHSTLNANFSGIRDPLIDRDYEAAASTASDAARSRDYAAIQTEMNKQAHWIPLYFRPAIVTDDRRVAPFVNNPTVAGPEWNMDQWRTTAAR